MRAEISLRNGNVVVKVNGATREYSIMDAVKVFGFDNIRRVLDGEVVRLELWG